MTNKRNNKLISSKIKPNKIATRLATANRSKFMASSGVVVDPSSNNRLITVQNLVTVSQTVCVHVEGPKTCWHTGTGTVG